MVDSLGEAVVTPKRGDGELAGASILCRIGPSGSVLVVGFTIVSLAGALILLLLVSPAVTRDDLPRNPALRFAVLVAFLMSILCGGLVVWHIRRLSLRLIATIGLAGGVWYFLSGLLDIDHLLINRYGWPNGSHQYFHVSEVAAAWAGVLAGLGIVLYRFWPRSWALRIPLMGLFAFCTAGALLANLIAAASFFRWTPYRDLIAIATHVPWAWTAAALGGLSTFAALVGIELLRAGHVAHKRTREVSLDVDR